MLKTGNRFEINTKQEIGKIVAAKAIFRRQQMKKINRIPHNNVLFTFNEI